jgi:nicotinamidase-related amidase
MTRVKRPHTTLVLVDLQRAFPVPPALLKRIGRYARRFDCRVFTRLINPPGSLFRTWLKQKCCAPGSADTELLLAPTAGDLVFDKTGYGLSPPQIRQLHRRGIREVTICGIDTDACVLGVMYSLFDAGIICRAKPDYCWSSTGLHRAGLKIIKTQFECLD